MIDWSIFIREMPGWETEWKRLNGELPPVSQSAPEQATWGSDLCQRIRVVDSMATFQARVQHRNHETRT